jgi:hypothetical protein
MVKHLKFVLLLGAVLAVANQTGAAEPDPRAASTARMAERLEQIARTVNPLRWLSWRQAVEVLKRMMTERPELARDPGAHFRLAEALLNSSRNLESPAEFEAVERPAAAQGKPVSGETN